MIWYTLFILSILILFILIPKNKLHKLWGIGVIGVILLYIIDSTLIKLGAFSYTYSNFKLSGLPMFYLLSGFAGSILLFNYYPHKSLFKFPYILLAALILLFIEIFIVSLGYMQHINWNFKNSYILNIFGFIITIWLSEWIINLYNFIKSKK